MLTDVSGQHIGPFFKIFWPLRMGRICCPETSVMNYHRALRNDPKESRSQSTSRRKPGITSLVWLKAMILFHMTLNLNVFCLNYFLWTVGLLMNHPPFMGAEGPKTTDLGCRVQRQSCDVRKGCQWPRTCFFLKPLLCVGTKLLLRGTPLGFACHTKS